MKSKINVFVNHSGQWDAQCNYSDFKVTGILVESCCTYKQLEDLLVHNVFSHRPTQKIVIEYQTRDGSPKIRISTDYDVTFYLELKKKDNDLTSFPLCITLESDPLLMPTRLDISNEASNSMCNESLGFNPVVSHNTEETSKTKLIVAEMCDEQRTIPIDLGDSSNNESCRIKSAMKKMKSLYDIFGKGENQAVVEEKKNNYNCIEASI